MFQHSQLIIQEMLSALEEGLGDINSPDITDSVATSLSESMKNPNEVSEAGLVSHFRHSLCQFVL